MTCLTRGKILSDAQVNILNGNSFAFNCCLLLLARDTDFLSGGVTFHFKRCLLYFLINQFREFPGGPVIRTPSALTAKGPCLILSRGVKFYKQCDMAKRNKIVN